MTDKLNKDESKLKDQSDINSYFSDSEIFSTTSPEELQVNNLPEEMLLNAEKAKRQKTSVSFVPTLPDKLHSRKFSCSRVGAPNDPVVDNGDKRPFLSLKCHRSPKILQTGFQKRKSQPSLSEPPTSFVSLCNYGYEPKLPGPLLKLNISGTCFLVKMDTLRKDPMVYEKILEDAEWIADTDEYYLERDPVVFRFVHFYLRYDELHLPASICGPLLDKELEAWGLQLGFDLQRCCLGPVMHSKSKLESLMKFESVFTEPACVSQTGCVKNDKWQAVREDVWRVIGDTPKKRWLNSNVNNNSFSKEDTEADTTSTPVSDAFSDTTTQLDSNLKKSKLGLMQQANDLEAHPVSQPENDHPYNYNFLESAQNQVICSRIYVTIQAIVICSLILLVILAYVENFRIPFGPKIDLTATNGSVPTDPFFVYRMYFAFDLESSRLTRPNVTIVSLTWLCVLLFTLDLIARAIFCPRFVKWLRSVYTITDILSLIPFYVEGFMYAYVAKLTDTSESAQAAITMLEVLDIINLLKMCVAARLFRILQRQRATRVLLYTIRTSALNMAMILELMILCAVFFGTAVFFLDNQFDTIFRGIWWALITMATVGYGDIVPGSIAGYTVAVFCVFAGILLTSYTVPILVNDFLLYYGHADQLAWMRRVHRAANVKRRTDRQDLMVKRRISLVRAMLRSTGNANPTESPNSPSMTTNAANLSHPKSQC